MQPLGGSDSSDDEFYEKVYSAAFFADSQDDGQAAEGDNVFWGDRAQFESKERRYKRQMGERKVPHMSARQSALQADQEKWENLQIRSSGVQSPLPEIVGSGKACHVGGRGGRAARHADRAEHAAAVPVWNHPVHAAEGDGQHREGPHQRLRQARSPGQRDAESRHDGCGDSEEE